MVVVPIKTMEGNETLLLTLQCWDFSTSYVFFG